MRTPFNQAEGLLIVKVKSYAYNSIMGVYLEISQFEKSCVQEKKDVTLKLWVQNGREHYEMSIMSGREGNKLKIRFFHRYK